MSDVAMVARTARLGDRGWRLGLVPWLPACILAALCAAAILAPLIAPYPPLQGSLGDKLAPPAWMAGGSWGHALGTDLLGRDILSRIFYGARTSLGVAAIAVLVSGTIGTIVGLVSGYFGGAVDALLMRLTDVALSLPLILVAIVLVAALGNGFGNVVLVIVLLLWPRYARQIRGETLALRERDFVALARIANCSHLRIIRRHILPNVVPTLLVLATLQSGYVVLLESTLSFLGAGIPPSTPAWGLMIAEGRTVIETAWWVVVWPGLAIVALVLSGNLLGDWLRDRLDPTLKRVR
jgi:peptide/nickel transport system permease protein